MSEARRLILHVDMDAFFAAVEQRDDPSLRGKPVLVGGKGKRGVVTTASYEARVFGCRSAMPMGRALKLCPHAIVVPGRFEAYREASRKVRAVLDGFSPDVEPVSIDEAYVDLTHVPTWNREVEIGKERLERGVMAAREIRRLVREATKLTASVGVSDSKFLAKVASDMDKPDGLSVLWRHQARAVLGPRSVAVLWGVGEVAESRLAELRIRTVDELLAFDEGELVRRFGDSARQWRLMALAEDERVVRSEREAKSIGKEHTFGDDIDDPDRLRAILLDEVTLAARSMREDGLACRRVVVKLRLPDFRTFTRSRALPRGTTQTDELWGVAQSLLDEFLGGRRVPLRLLGVSLQDLSPPESPGLFDQTGGESGKKSLDAVTDAIADKFGVRAIGRARALDAQRRPDTGNSAKNQRTI